MSKYTEWTEAADDVFADAVQAIREDLANGYSFEHSLSHYADLFEISEEALLHEWNVREEDK